MSAARYESNSFDESSIFTSHQGPITLLDRLGYVKQLVYSRTKLEFRLLWNKIFQKEDDELSWLLNPYNPNAAGQADSRSSEATLMKSFNKNTEEGGASYQYDYGDVSNALGREKVTIYNRGVARRPGVHRGNRRRDGADSGEKKTLGESALEIARYMGMGVYMTSTSFPSPFFPVNESHFHQGETFYTSALVQNEYATSKLW